eukprot:scaffold22023_cov42-Cyclotella_meneghiniana.AAC.2
MRIIVMLGLSFMFFSRNERSSLFLLPKHIWDFLPSHCPLGRTDGSFESSRLGGNRPKHWLMRPARTSCSKRVVVGRVIDSAMLEEKLVDLRLEVRVWDAIPSMTTLLIKLMSIG